MKQKYEDAEMEVVRFDEMIQTAGDAGGSMIISSEEEDEDSRQ